MRKIIIFVRDQSSAAESPAERTERHTLFRNELHTRVAQLAATDPGMRGAVISDVQRSFATDDRLVALIELWAETEVPGELVGQCIPAEISERSKLTVGAVSTSEIVFKRVIERATPGSAWAVKLAGTAYRRDDFAPDAFFDYWTNVHAHIGGSVPWVGGYVVSRVDDVLAGAEDADALIEQWYPDEATFDAAQGSPQAANAWSDVANYAKTTGVFWLMTETTIAAPRSTGPGTLESANA